MLIDVCNISLLTPRKTYGMNLIKWKQNNDIYLLSHCIPGLTIIIYEHFVFSVIWELKAIIGHCHTSEIVTVNNNDKYFVEFSYEEKGLIFLAWSKFWCFFIMYIIYSKHWLADSRTHYFIHMSYWIFHCKGRRKLFI